MIKKDVNKIDNKIDNSFNKINIIYNTSNKIDNIIDNSFNINRNYYVYLLIHNIHNKTYLGITNNLKRRLRQHNREIKGGAKYTSMNLMNGKWNYYLLIPNLTKREALSKERIIKNKRRKGKGKTPLDRRLDIIIKLNYNYLII